MGGFGGAANTGRMMVNLKPRRQREARSVDIVNRLRPKVSNFPGLRVFMSVPQAIRVGGRMQKTGYDFTLYGPDTEQLYAEAPKLERVLARMPGLQDVSSDLQIKNPRVNIILDRDRAAALGLNWIGTSQRSVRRLRPAILLHHLCAEQSVPRPAGDAAAVPDPYRRAEA